MSKEVTVYYRSSSNGAAEAVYIPGMFMVSRYSSWIVDDVTSWILEGVEDDLDLAGFTPVPKDNKLNRLLYPDREVIAGYLVSIENSEVKRLVKKCYFNMRVKRFFKRLFRFS